MNRSAHHIPTWIKTANASYDTTTINRVLMSTPVGTKHLKTLKIMKTSNMNKGEGV